MVRQSQQAPLPTSQQIQNIKHNRIDDLNPKMAFQLASNNCKYLSVKAARTTSKTQNSGAFYFCGRDDKYRPIIVADIGKFDPDEVELIPKALIIIMEFMIKNLLIEGQVENYILIMNLEQATFSLRSVRIVLCRLL